MCTFVGLHVFICVLFVCFFCLKKKNCITQEMGKEKINK